MRHRLWIIEIEVKMDVFFRQRQMQDDTIIIYVLSFGATYIRDSTVFIWGRTTLIIVMKQSSQRYKTHIPSSRYSPCVQFIFNCWKLFWNIKWRGRRLYVAYASVIKLSFTRFAPNPQRDHDNLIMFITVVCVISKLYALHALIFNCCNFRFNVFYIGIFTLVFLHVVYLLLCTYVRNDEMKNFNQSVIPSNI